MKEPGPTSRTRALRTLEERPVDVLVVGGGIVGAGVARDAAMRGLRVALVEQNDFAFGTSSRSSRLLHGGLRYLAQGRIGMVRQASVEKLIIQRIAPHLAAPLPFIFPVFRDDKDWVLWQLKLGVKVYDLLCGGRNFAASSWLTSQQLLEKVPGLRAPGLKGGVQYYDGFTNDARLTLDTIRSAVRNGGTAVNYCRLIAASKRQAWHCTLEDTCQPGVTLTVQASAIVNATGPWAESVPHSGVKLRLTKGAHLVLQGSRLPVRETVVMTEGSRILFAIPWGQRTIIGTTDTDYEGPLGDIRADAGDVKYLLEIANRFFPSARLEEIDIISSWAGLRPLVADPSGKPSDISRAHEITSPQPSWWDITGGKLTTYRLMAEEAVDRVARHLQRRGLLRAGLSSCRTAEEPLLASEEAKGISGLVPPDLDEAVVEYHCRNEWARHVDDVMIRRSGWHYYCPERVLFADRVSRWMAEFLSWPEATRQLEMENYLALCKSTPEKQAKHES